MQKRVGVGASLSGASGLDMKVPEHRRYNVRLVGPLSINILRVDPLSIAWHGYDLERKENKWNETGSTLLMRCNVWGCSQTGTTLPTTMNVCVILWLFKFLWDSPVKWHLLLYVFIPCFSYQGRPEDCIPEVVQTTGVVLILGGLAYFAAVLNMIGDWLRVLSKKTKEEVCSHKKWLIPTPCYISD